MKVSVLGMEIGKAQYCDHLENCRIQFYNFQPEITALESARNRTIAINYETGILSTYPVQGPIEEINLAELLKTLWSEALNA